jgi:prephenate dehydratase
LILLPFSTIGKSALTVNPPKTAGEQTQDRFALADEAASSFIGTTTPLLLPMTRIAFQGTHGANSEVAARKVFGALCSTLPRDTFEDVFAAVVERKAVYAIIPIENSLAGSIHQNYDLLLSHTLHIVGETQLRIQHALMAPRGVPIRALRFVRSHPQALAQCGEFFRTHPTIKPVPFFDTAGAAESLLTEHRDDTGAIANALAARLYGLSILRRNVENREKNITRFLVLGRTPSRPRKNVRTKTSIVFSPAQNQVGILFRILGVFALRDIDLVKIESRPDPKRTFSYLFYCDLAGNPSEPNVAHALEHLREMVTRLKILGVYRRSV